MSSGWDDLYGKSTFRDESSVPRNWPPWEGPSLQSRHSPKMPEHRKVKGTVNTGTCAKTLSLPSPLSLPLPLHPSALISDSSTPLPTAPSLCPASSALPRQQPPCPPPPPTITHGPGASLSPPGLLCSWLGHPAPMTSGPFLHPPEAGRAPGPLWPMGCGRSDARCGPWNPCALLVGM